MVLRPWWSGAVAVDRARAREARNWSSRPAEAAPGMYPQLSFRRGGVSAAFASYDELRIPSQRLNLGAALAGCLGGCLPSCLGGCFGGPLNGCPEGAVFHSGGRSCSCHESFDTMGINMSCGGEESQRVPLAGPWRSGFMWSAAEAAIEMDASCE